MQIPGLRIISVFTKFARHTIRGLNCPGCVAKPTTTSAARISGASHRYSIQAPQNEANKSVLW